MEVRSNKDVFIHKGTAAKSEVSKEWFIQQYEVKSMTLKVKITNRFRLQMKKLTISKQESELTLSKS